MSAWRRKVTAQVVRPEINVTPLVDVVLVLLIIFMVVAPRMDQDVHVDLPGIFNADPDVEGAMDPFKVSVAQAGAYYVGEQRYDLDGAIEALGAMHAAEPLRRLVLRADAGLRYGDVRAILARAQEVGFPGLSFMVGERHRPGAEAVAAARVGEDTAPSETGGAAGAAPPPEG